MAEAKDKAGQRFPDDYTIAELHATVTHALANGDDYARALLREQLKTRSSASGQTSRTIISRSRKWL
jgi:hypothetical protein